MKLTDYFRYVSARHIDPRKTKENIRRLLCYDVRIKDIEAALEELEYKKNKTVNGVKVWFHPQMIHEGGLDITSQMSPTNFNELVVWIVSNTAGWLTYDEIMQHFEISQRQLNDVLKCMNKEYRVMKVGGRSVRYVNIRAPELEGLSDYKVGQHHESMKRVRIISPRIKPIKPVKLKKLTLGKMV